MRCICPFMHKIYENSSKIIAFYPGSNTQVLLEIAYCLLPTAYLIIQCQILNFIWNNSKFLSYQQHINF